MSLSLEFGRHFQFPRAVVSQEPELTQGQEQGRWDMSCHQIENILVLNLGSKGPQFPGPCKK